MSDKFLTNRRAIHKWLLKNDIENYTLNDDLTVDVADNVFLRHRNIAFIPIQFGQIDGSFDIAYNDLKDLKGSPRKVSENFSCSYNKLTNLKYAPNYVNNVFRCTHNQITHLNNFFSVMNLLDCSFNPIQIEKAVEFKANYFKHKAPEKDKILLFKDNYQNFTLQLTLEQINEKCNALKEKELLEKNIDNAIDKNKKLKL
jgi:hypothetical protein